MTKKLLLFPVLIFILPLLSVAKPAKVTGLVTNSSAYTKIYLYEFFGSDLVKKDSSILSKNTFTFQTKDGFARGFYQIKFDDKTFITLILGNEDISINADLKDLPSTLKIANSKENEVYNSFKSYIEIQNIQMRNLQTEANKASALQNTDPSAFQVKMTQLQGRYDSLMGNQQAFYKELTEKNKGLFISKFIQQLIINPEHTKDTYLTPNDFNDTELLRSDVLISKLSFYFSPRFTEQSLEAWTSSANNLIEKTKGTKGQEVLFQTLINMFSSADMDLTSSIAQQYAKAYPKSEKSKKILASLPKPSPKVGDVAPDILLPDPSGNKIPLTSLKGKVVLIDFWASWCGPCRMENPNVVNVFNKYKDKGFMIYSVSLDNDRNKWLQAIEKDKLTWIHVSDLKNWQSEGAALYGVRSIPATYLLDKNGKIIAKNLRGEKLEEELKKILEVN